MRLALRCLGCGLVALGAWASCAGPAAWGSAGAEVPAVSGKSAARESPAAPGPGGDGGLAELAPDDVAALREALGTLESLAADVAETEEMRVLAIAAVSRIHEALNDWGRPGLERWYLDLLGGRPTGKAGAELLKGGEAAAKGGQYHLGGVHQFWLKVDALVKEKDTALSAQGEALRKAFYARVDHFEKPRRLWASPKPMTLSARKFNMASLLKPLEEPKPPKPAPAKPTPTKASRPKPAV